MLEETIIDVVPCDIWLKIFDYGVIKDALQVYDLTNEFERACCHFIKHELLSLRNKTLQGISAMQDRLRDHSIFDDNLRVTMVKSVMFLRYLLTELNILLCTVIRYSSNSKAWMILAPHLTPAIEELDTVRRNAVTLELHREELTNFNIRLLLNRYYEFLGKFDSELENRISEVMKLTPFEIKVIDILSCCPSINSQLSVMKEVNGNDMYNISSFFKIHNLKPIFQVPDVHNTNLSTDDKQSKLMVYLRDCVQWENVSFLQEIIHNITDMEMRLNMNFLDEYARYMLIGNLLQKYESIHSNPYEPIVCSLFMSKQGSGVFLNEHYTKQATLNQNMTGLCAIITIPNQPAENLPIIVHSFRGKMKPFADEELLDEVYEEFNLCKMKDNISNHLTNKRAFQLCINFREGLNSTSAEAIIDVSYDHIGESHVSMNIVKSEPFAEENLINPG